jgi:hypothetical protein
VYFVHRIEFAKWGVTVSSEVVFDIGDGIFINGLFVFFQPGLDVLVDGASTFPSLLL